MDARSVCWANCIRAGARPTSCRSLRSCSNWSCRRCWRATYRLRKRCRATSRPKDGGERSLAVRLTLQDDAATLTDERIEQAIQAVLASLQTQLDARLRS